MKRIPILLFLLFGILSINAQKKTVSIGILVDDVSSKTQPLLSDLKSEITAVVGEYAEIKFKDVLTNKVIMLLLEFI